MTLLILVGCDPAPQQAAVEDLVWERAVLWLVAQHAPDAGTVHAVREAGQLSHDDRLLRWATAQQERFRNDAWGCLLDATQTVAPAAGAPRGLARLHWFLLQSMQPLRTATCDAALTEFLALDLHGYLLTHQLYALHWARERGGGGSVAPDRVKVLVRRMREEAGVLPVFSDLFAEQCNLLLAFGEKLPGEWETRLRAAAGPTGAFEDATEWRIHFDGEEQQSASNSVHTTAQVLLALARWGKR